MSKKVLYPLIVLMVGFGIAALIAVNEPKIDPVLQEPTPRTVRVMEARASTEYLVINSQGSVQPRTQSELIPEVSGRVVWISPALVGGGSFREGEALLRIEQADYQSSVQRNEANLTRAEVENEFAGDELKRLQKLHKQQLASQQQLDSARRTARVAEANLADGRASLEQARRDLARTELLAPFEGLVRSEQVDLGQFVTRGQSIGTIYATDYAEVRLPISADQLVYLGLPVATRGQIAETYRPEVTVSSDFGSATLLWDGQLVRLEAEIDERSRMIYGVTRVKMEDREDRPILPVGMFVQAEIRGRRVENVVRLPRSAMRDNNQVLVVDAQDRLHFRQVTVLRLEHDDMLISSGLTDGERVCVSPLQTVVEGMRVRPVLE